jgi:D-threo-aldose 1-dehydrogenase
MPSLRRLSDPVESDHVNARLFTRQIEHYHIGMEATLALGGAPLGNLFTPVTDDDAIALVRHAIDRGVRYIDTAPHYGNGLSEHRIGAALRDVPRDAYVLSTKVGRLLAPDPGAPRTQNGFVNALPFVQRWDYSRDGTLRSIEDSLQRLGLARIDYVFIHDVARDAHGDAQPQRFREAMDGAVPALARLKAEGTIAAFGLGVNDWRVCVDALAQADLDLLLVAGRYTLLDQTALPELLPLCVKRGTRIVLGGPFNSGILATGTRPADGGAVYFNYAPAPTDVIARATAIEGLCATHGVPLMAAALQFPRAHPAVARVLAGARSTAELDQNLALFAHPIPEAFWRDLRSRRLVAENAPLPCDAAQ